MKVIVSFFFFTCCFFLVPSFSHAQYMTPTSYSSFSDLLQYVGTSTGEILYVSYNPDGTFFNGGSPRICPVAGYCFSPGDGWIDESSSLEDFHILFLWLADWDTCTSLNTYDECIAAVTPYDDVLIQYIPESTSTPPTSTTTYSTTTVNINTQNIEFLLIVITFFMSFIFFGLVFNPFKKT